MVDGSWHTSVPRVAPLRDGLVYVLLVLSVLFVPLVLSVLCPVSSSHRDASH